MNQSSAPALSGFASFRLDATLQRAVAAIGFTEPRPIQTQALPAALAGRDLLGLAQTGTGKTAAYVLPLLQRVLSTRKQGPLALVLAPTRELAAQIDAELRALARFTRIQSLTIYGGVSMAAQIRGLKRRPDILVACPGRLIDLHEQGCVDLTRIEALVLDEADHMFDMGFLPSIRRILELLPAKRQNLLFSATMSAEIRSLADRILSEPHVVELSNSQPAETIEHALYPVKAEQKQQMLERLLASDECRSAIVFTRTKQRAKRLAERLVKLGHEAVALQGNMSQSQRDKAMSGFRSGRYEVLVATDLVARGIDVSDVSIVINFDAPNTPQAYTHRIGRTGRAERAGRACTFVGHEDFEWIRATERHLGAAIEQRSLAGFEPVMIRGIGDPTIPAAVPGRRKKRISARGKRRAYGKRGGVRRAS
jgi:superfamily II DNA/RNA helicase